MNIPLKPFFVVWNPERGPPRVRHETYTDAFNEAQRLALNNRGDRFHILGVIATLETAKPVHVTEYARLPDATGFDDIPF